MQVFKDTFSISSPQQVKHLGKDGYDKLVEKTRHSWEKKALLELLGLSEDSIQKEKEDKVKQAQVLIEELEKLKKAGKDRNDSALKELEEEISKLSPASKSVSAGDVSIEKLKVRLEEIIIKNPGTLKKRSGIKDSQVVQSASAGLSLKGVLISKDPSDLLKQRSELLLAPTEAQLLGPSMKQSEELKEFGNEHAEGKFSEFVDSLGIHATLAVKFVSLLSIEATGSYSRNQTKKITMEKHQEEAYYSTMKYSIVPQASFTFKDHELQFSHDSLSKLQAINDLLPSDHSPTLQDECLKFFQKFGSHIYKGPIHFGGFYISKCFSKGFQQTEKEYLIKMQKNALSASASASFIGTYGCVPYKVGGSVEGGGAMMESSNAKSEKKDLSHLVKLETSISGGPPEVSELQQWKAGLAESNSTWSVIDRGTILVPVWDIVEVNE